MTTTYQLWVNNQFQIATTDKQLCWTWFRSVKGMREKSVVTVNKY